ncbi:nucleolar pre-ribosomal-associated protein, partial [Pimephales promelas]
SGVGALQLKAFLHTLDSVLMHHGTALNAHKEAGWLTLHPQKVSCSEVLSLLQRWATLARDASLLSALQTLINKHRVKELMGKKSPNTSQVQYKLKGSSNSVTVV